MPSIRALRRGFADQAAPIFYHFPSSLSPHFCQHGIALTLVALPTCRRIIFYSIFAATAFWVSMINFEDAFWWLAAAIYALEIVA